MKFGVGYFPTDDGVDPVTLARLCEERGIESLLFTDHTPPPGRRSRARICAPPTFVEQ